VRENVCPGERGMGIVERLRWEDSARVVKGIATEAADEIERLRAALAEITLCDDDGYGPRGHCVNIAKRALAALVSGKE